MRENSSIVDDQAVTSDPLCPDCGSPVNVPADAVVTEIVWCGKCRAELEVVGLAPTLLALAPEVEEDWGE